MAVFSGAKNLGSTQGFEFAPTIIFQKDCTDFSESLKSSPKFAWRTLANFCILGAEMNVCPANYHSGAEMSSPKVRLANFSELLYCSCI